ncbi:hypothetical protein BSKO_13988 [Bryopsis sp. KO-2023]|nr:hypothetical protein BSKO_13988 [Bryopsis sp. KO-2023]
MVSAIESRLLSDASTNCETRAFEAGKGHPLVEHVLKGEYNAVFSHPEFRALAKLDDLSQSKRVLSERIQNFRMSVHDATFAAIQEGNSEVLMGILSMGVAALSTFVCDNLTGPESNSCPGPFISPSTENSVEHVKTIDNQWAELQLNMDGEDFLAKLRNPQYLLLARAILVEPLRLKDLAESDMEALSEIQSEGLAPETATRVAIGDFEADVEEVDCWESDPKVVMDALVKVMPSWLWWAGRCIFAHQELLSTRAGTLRIELVEVGERMDKLGFPPLSLVERGLWELRYGRVEGARKLIERAEQDVGVQVSVTGAMGMRTVHQQDPKAQLLLDVRRDSSNSEVLGDGHETASLGFEGYDSQPTDKELEGLGESDVLEKPRFLGGESATDFPQLSSLEQCVVLARNSLVEYGTAKDELRSWEMVPYVEAIRSQLFSRFIFQAAASLQRARHEFERSRTRERSIMMMENLVNRVRNKMENEKPKDRLSFAFGTCFFTIASLRKEYCEQLVSMGIVGGAMQTYEELEMWDNLLLCYRLINKNAQAEALVLKRLEVEPDSPKLWCALGDLRQDDACYVKAWKKSLHKYGRAQRSLARSAMRRKDYEQAAKCFEKALSRNPLQPDVWFSMGYCYLKIDDSDGALKSFTRCAQLEPENGEAWNNLGALWLKVGKSNRAFWALKEALKHKSGSWELWENYARAALDCENFSQCLRAVMRIFEVTQGKILRAETVAPLVERHKEERRLDENSSTNQESEGSVKKFPNWHAALGQFLKDASTSNAWTPELWRLRGQYHANLGESDMAKDCLMKAARKLQGSEWKKDATRFEQLASVLVELAEHSISIAERQIVASEAKSGDASDLGSLRLMIRGVVKVGLQKYEDSEGYANLEKILGRIETVEGQLRALEQK